MNKVTGVLFFLIFYGVSDAQRRRDSFMRPRNEEHHKICLFLPLENLEGRRLGTCCVFPGRHRRFFGETVLARKPRRAVEEQSFQEQGEEESLQNDNRPPPPPPPQGPPSCDIHPLMLRERRVGVCCTFTGRFRGKPEETILPEAKEEAEATTESTDYSSTTIAVPLSFDTRDFINSSCREGYVLDANYNCVMAFK